MPKVANVTAVSRESSGGRRLLTRLQTAEYLGVSQATLSRWAADRSGPPFIKLHDGEAGAVRYPSDLLDEYIESRIKQPKAK
jgi:predicted DNA-binding transcriptional regulator AlpA